MEENSWNIYWNEYAKSSYLYGTELIFHKKNDVEIINDLMPPGTVLKTWYSKVNYQGMRIEPSLPMIDGESKYKIKTNISGAGENAFLLRMIFYDKYDAKAGSIIIRDKEMEFQCPLKTYSYKVELINAGTSGFHFHYITISEVSDE